MTKSLNEALALTNCVITHPADFPSNVRYICVDNHYYFNIKPAEGIARRELGTSLFNRKYAMLSLNQEVQVRPYDPASDGLNFYLSVLSLQV